MEIYSKIKNDNAKVVKTDPLKEEGGCLNVEDQGYYLLGLYEPLLGGTLRVKKANDENLTEAIYLIEIFYEGDCLLLEFYDTYEDCLDSLLKYIKKK